MKRIARAVLVAGISMGAAVLAAPSAMADIHVFVVEKADIGHNGPVYVVEGGPGDLSYSNVTGSPKASPKVGNEAVKTGDHKTSIHGGKDNSAVTEVEGSEQDQIKPGHGKKDSGKEESAETDAKGAEGKDGHAKDGHAKEADAKDGHAKEADAKDGHAKEADAKGSDARQAKPSGGHDKAQPKTVYAAKKADVGNNGPTLVAESGPGDLSYSNVTGSPKASPMVGNEAVQTGDITTSLKGGKGNTAIAEVEGSEQDAGEK